MSILLWVFSTSVLPVQVYAPICTSVCTDIPVGKLNNTRTDRHSIPILFLAMSSKASACMQSTVMEYTESKAGGGTPPAPRPPSPMSLYSSCSTFREWKDWGQLQQKKQGVIISEWPYDRNTELIFQRSRQQGFLADSCKIVFTGSFFVWHFWINNHLCTPLNCGETRKSLAHLNINNKNK